MLRLILIVVGGLFCLSGATVVLPESSLKDVTGWLVGAETVEEFWPAAPLFAYALRTSLLAYLWIGVVLLVAATNPVRHKVQIYIAIVGLFLLGVVCFVTGFSHGVPTSWYLIDTLFSLVAAGLLVAFRPGREKGQGKRVETKRAQTKRTEKEIGRVSHYFGKLRVAAIEITTRGLSVGDTIHIKGHTSDFRQTVDSIQIDGKPARPRTRCSLKDLGLNRTITRYSLRNVF